MFKSLIAYKYNKSETDFSKIQTQIKNKLFKEITNFDTFSSGFSSFTDDIFIIESDNRILLKIIFSSKTVSARTVNSLLYERIEQLKRDNNNEEVSNAVREIYKEQLQRECLKYTEPVNKIVYLLIDKYINYIYVSTSNSNLAEDALHLLRNVIGKLVCRQLESNKASFILSRYLQKDKNIRIPNNLKIPVWPKIKARDEEGSQVADLKGFDILEPDLVMLLQSLSITSLSMSLVNSDKNNLKLASFILTIKKNGILIFSNFTYDDNLAEDDETTSDDLYSYTSKMLLIGRYMKSIIESFVDFFELEDK